MTRRLCAAGTIWGNIHFTAACHYSKVPDACFLLEYIRQPARWDALEQKQRAVGVLMSSPQDVNTLAFRLNNFWIQ